MAVKINSHTYKPEPKFFGSPHLGTYFGVELELDVKGHKGDDSAPTRGAAEDTASVLGDFVYFKHDGSIQGVEIVTHPASLQVHRTRWKKFFASVPDNFLVAAHNGMHVHFTKKGLNKHQLWLIHNFINSQAKPGASSGTSGCTGDGAQWLTKLAGRDFNGHAWRVIKPESKLTNFEQHGKYEAVNCAPSTTVEVRLFAATLKYQEFMLRLEFTAAMVQAVQQGTDPLTLESLKDFLRNHPKRFPVLVPWLAKEKQL